jgi:molybdopterin synthase catalytic subunit
MMTTTRLELKPGPLDVTALLASVPLPPAHGAQLVFSGVVRDRNHGRTVTAVSYEAFSPLCETVFSELARDARARWGEELAITILHATGRLEVGQASVLIVVSSPHRREAFEASRFLIDELKTRAPIWKQEHYVDGQTEWLPGHALCGHGEKHDHDHVHVQDQVHDHDQEHLFT